MKNKNEIEKSNKKSFLEWINYWGLIVVLFLTPLLYFSDRLGGAVASKQFFFIGAVNLLLIPWTWLLIKDSRYRFDMKHWYLFIPGLLFIGSAGVSTFLGVDVMTSLFSTVGRGIGFIFLIYVYLFSLIITSVIQVQKIDFFKKIIQAGFSASVIVALSTFFTNESFDIGSKWLNNTVGGGLLGNSSLAGAYLVFGLFFGIIVFITKKTIREKIFAIIGLLIIACSPMFINMKGLFVKGITWKEFLLDPLILIGQARAATVGILIGLGISVLVYIIFISKKAWLKYGAGILLGVGMIAGIYTGIQIGIKDSFSQKVFIDQVGDNRLVFWKAAEKGIKDRPIIGWGLENFRIVQNKYFDPELLGAKAGHEVWNDKPHNVFIEILVTQGIFGFVGYIIILGSLIGYAIVLTRRGVLHASITSLFIGMIIAYTLQNQVVFDSISSTIMFWVTTGVLSGLLMDTISVGVQKKNITTNQIWYWIGGLISCALVIGWIFFAVLPSRKMIEAKKVFDAPTVSRIKSYGTLFSGFGANYIYTDLGIISYALAETYSNERRDIAVDPRYIKVALQEMSKYISVIEREKYFGQNDYRLKLSKVMFQEVSLSLKKEYTQAEADKMIHDAEDAVQLAPTNPLGYLVYGRTLTFANRISEARAAIDKAIMLNPTIPQAYDLKISFEGFYGTKEQQRKALADAMNYVPGYQSKQ